MKGMHDHDDCGCDHDLDDLLGYIREHLDRMPPEAHEPLDTVAEIMLHDFDKTAGRLFAINSRDLQVGAMCTLNMLRGQFDHTPYFTAYEAALIQGVISAVGAAFIVALDKANE